MNNSNFNHLYIHIPFCASICTYCDFVRKVSNSENEMTNYVNKVINEIKSISHKLKTIYIGGGTPNYLSELNLIRLLDSLQKNIDSNTEFTIECNPEFLSDYQAKIFNKYKVNRISLGMQSTNENVLKNINRKHNVDTCKIAIKNLYKNNINNISIDFIYNLPLLELNDIDDSIQFCIDHEIKHISFYALEIKDGSIMNKNKEILNLEKESEQFEYILKKMSTTNYIRYEISNWSINNNFKSHHNCSYWKMDNWKAIGYGSYGLENKNYYYIDGSYNDWKLKNNILNNHDYYQYILIMGLRLIDGIDLSIKKNNDAYNYFKNKLNASLIEIKNNKLKAKNINLLNNILVDII